MTGDPELSELAELQFCDLWEVKSGPTKSPLLLLYRLCRGFCSAFSYTVTFHEPQ